MNTHPSRLGALVRSRRTSLIAALGLSTSLLAAVPAAADPAPTPSASTAPAPAADPLAPLKAEAKKQNKRIEIESYRTETSTTYANPDGKTLRVELSTEPVRVKKADGKGFTPIDTTLVEAGSVIKPKAAKGDLVLSAGRDKTLLKNQAADATAKITMPSALPVPELKGNTATYRSAYGKGRDLMVIATRTGFQQQITIAERPTGPVSFRVPFDLPKGMSFGKNAAGRPTIVGKDGKTLTEVRPTLMRDVKAADTDAPLDAGKIGKAAVTLAEDGKTLVFTPDATFLADAATTYPVTMTAAASDWYEGHTGEWADGGMDAYINDVDLTDSWDTFADPEVVVGKSYASSIAKRWRGYLKFPDLPTGFAGSKVQNADLHLWNHQSNTCGESVGSGITARRVTSAWDDMLLHWNSQPSVTSTGADTEYGAYSEDCNYAWNLTHSINGIAQAWIDGATNYGIQLTAGNESELRNWRRYASEDAGGCRTAPLEDCKFELHPPILTVDVELPAPPPPPLLDDVFMFTDTQLTTMPEYEEALAKSGYVPENPEPVIITEQLADKIAGQRDGQVNAVGTDDLPPVEVDPGDDTEGTTPLVTGVEPADGATEVPLDTSIKVTFSEAVADAIVTIKDAGGTQVVGTSVYDDTRTVLTFTPAQALKPGTTYSAEVSEASNSWEIPINPHSWSFTTLIQSAGHWTFDEGDSRIAADSSGKGHDARLNETASWTSGKFGNALTNTPTNPAPTVTGSADPLKRLLGLTAPPRANAVALAPTVNGFSVAPSQAVSGSIVTSSLTPSLKTTATDAAAGTSTVEFQVLRYSDDSLVWSGSVVNVASGSQASVSVPAGKLVDGVKYEWRVRATASGVTSAWSPYQFFTVDVPEAVVDQFQVTPSSGSGSSIVSSSLTPALKARVTDPLGGPAAVAFEVARYSDDVVVWSGSLTGVASGTQASVSVPAGKLVDGVKYEWRVKATTPGSTPSWTAYQFFTVDAAPQIGQLQVSPSKVGADGIVTTTSLTPTLLARVVDQLGGKAAVAFEVARYSDDVVVWSGSVADVASGTQASVSVPASKLIDGTKYEWRVKATASGATSAWTSYQFFTVDVPEAVVDQFQITPSSGTGPSIVTPSLTPTLQVRVTDPLGGPATVAFEVRDYATDTLQWSGSLKDIVSGAPAAIAVPNGELADGTRYGWRVKATTPGSTPSWTDYQYFTVDVPEAVVDQFQVTPSETVNATMVTTSLTPILLTRITDPLGGTATVEFQVADYATDTVFWSTTVNGIASGAQTSVTVPSGKLADKIEYEFRVKATTSGSTPAWSAWQRFRTDVFDPATDPAVSQFQVIPSHTQGGVAVASSVTPELRALVSHPQGSASRVEFEVEHDPTAPQGQGSGQIWSTALNNVASGTVAAAVPAEKLADGWLVRWRMRSLAGSSSSTWSAWQQLKVAVPKPGVDLLQVTPSQVVDGKTVTSVVRPSLHAQVTYAPGGNLRAEFEIEHHPAAPQGQGTGQIWTGAVDNAAAGTQVTAAVPAGTLTDGWQVRWRARTVTGELSSPWSDWQTLLVDQPDSAPAVQEPQVIPSAQADGRIVTPTMTPHLQVTVLDPRGEPVQAEFELEHDPNAPQGQGAGKIWTTAIDNTAVGTQAVAEVPSGRLTDGWQVRWRARATSATASSPWSDWQRLTVEIPKPGVDLLQVTPSQVVDGKTVTSVVRPSLHAQVTYAPGGSLRAEFEIEHHPAAPQGQGTGQIWTGAVDNAAAGTQVTAAVPAGTLTDGWQVRWRARSLAAGLASPWSEWQQLTVKRPDSEPAVSELQAVPSQQVKEQTVTSSETPHLHATLTDPRGDGLTAQFEIEHDPAAPEGQGTGQVWTGNVSDVQTAAQAVIAVPAGKLTDGWLVRWRARATSATASSPWSDWQQLKVDVIHPGEEPLAQTAGPVIRTDESFTAAAWLRWSDKDGDYTVIEQKGTHTAPFRLGNTPDHGLVFTLTSADTADATTEGVLSGVEPPVDEWFHLAGVYDASAKTTSLYLNGTLIKSVPISFSAWNAGTAMTLGASMLGDLDDVQVYQRPLTAIDVAALLTSTNQRTTQNADSSSQPSQTASRTSTTAEDFDYDHFSLEDCLRSPKHPTIDYARLQERPFSSCWTSWVSMGTYEAAEYGDGPDGRRWVKASNKVGTSRSGGRAGIVASVLELTQGNTLPNDIIFQFRATWVTNSYVGNWAGTEVANAGGSGLKPQNMKLFLRLTDFALYWNGKRYPINEETAEDIQELPLTFEVQTESDNLTPCRSITGSTTKTIREWEKTSSTMYLLESNPIAGGPNAICTIKPMLTRFHNNRRDLPLWSPEIVGAQGKRLGVARHGYARLPGDLSTLAAPYYRCDRDKVINHTGGCVNDRAHRVFEMSESKNPEFAEVTRHIKAALDPSVNGLTSPPLRPGHDWSRPEYPPTKRWTGTEQPKTIPGNWNVASSPPLHKRPAGTSGFNRKFFSGIEMYMDDGKHWSASPITNYCKYYFRDQYPKAEDSEGMPWAGGRTRPTRLECDEYPFASTYQGAAGNGRGTGHYSIRAVNGGHNDLHGRALKGFYDKYHVATHHAFWVSVMP